MTSMQYPNYQDKSKSDAVFSPDDFIEYQRKRGKLPKIEPPVGVILCYQTHLMNYILKTHSTTKVDGFGGTFHVLNETDDRIGVVGNFGIGAPGAVTVLEELIAFGTRKYLSIGTAGALQPDLNSGDIVVCDRAIRDEGASYHYLKAAKYAFPAPGITGSIKEALQQFQVPFKCGTTWTTDAPYRETIAEVKHYQQAGVLTVEMEAAALFTVGEFRKVEIGTILTISDSIANLEWELHFHKKRTKQGLEMLFKAACRALSV